MSNWSSQVLTPAGRALQAKLEAGKTMLEFTKMVLGSGKTSAADVETLTALKEPKLELGISEVKISETDANICTVTALANSSDVDSTFEVSELGLYANDPNVGEILYIVTVDSNPDLMPNKNASSPLTLTYQFDIVTSNAENVTAIINPTGLATVGIVEQAIKQHNTEEDAHPYLRTLIQNSGINILKRSHTYEVGDIAYSPLLKSYQRLECVVGGTTADTDIDLASSTTGGAVVDGSCTWLLTDVRDGTPVGAVRGSLYVPLGYTKANGATVQRADYPRLVRLADEYNLWTDDTNIARGRFGRGDGSTTFVLPNWTGLFEQFADTETGQYVEAGLPNIEGDARVGKDAAFSNTRATITGAFFQNTNTGYMTEGDGIHGNCYTLGFDASKSNPIYGKSATVQPPATRMIPIIRY